MAKGILLIVSGPAGSGKGTVVSELLKAHRSIRLSISATTRNPRPGEQNGVHYYFISKKDFENRIENGEILEYTTYCDNYYGTPVEGVERALARGKDVVLEIEVDGAMQVKKKFPDAVTVMLTPPDKDTLENRLRSRGTETDEVIAWRLERAKQEISHMPEYDYSVINEDGMAKECAEKIFAILTAEHLKTRRTKRIIKKFI